MELKNRSIVKLRNGNYGMIVDDYIIMLNPAIGYSTLSQQYNDNFTNKTDDGFDIMVIYRPINDLRLVFDSDCNRLLSKIWDREMIAKREKAFIDYFINNKESDVACCGVEQATGIIKHCYNLNCKDCLLNELTTPTSNCRDMLKSYIKGEI